MSILKDKLYEKIQEHRSRTSKLVKEYGDKVIDQVTVGQALGGMRGIKSLVTDISYLDPYEGIRYRGFTLPEVLKNYLNLKVQKCPMLKVFIFCC